MDDERLLRYARQILLPQFGIEGQRRLEQARVLIVGAGGLGSPAALYLAAAGVGALTIADPDRVDISNLQRQILHGQADLGRDKAVSAAGRLRELAPETRVRPLVERLAGATLAREVAAADLVLDASDNFETRFAVNAACVAARRPLVSGAAIRFEGQLAVFDSRHPDSPCYRCLYRDQGQAGETCAENGILGPVTGVIGSLQALEAIKLLTGIGEPLRGRLLLFDGLAQSWRSLTLPRDPDCPVCGAEETP